MRRILTILLCFVIAGYLHAPNAFACSCLSLGPAMTSFFSSDTIFSGRVLDIKNPEAQNGIMSSADPVQVTFDVFKSYKGLRGNNVVVTTTLSDDSCGYDFKNGQEYLVYANKSSGDNLSVSLCSRTALLSGTRNDIRAFNALFGFEYSVFLGIIALIIYIVSVRKTKKPILSSDKL